jgi:hypothetical protein
MAIPPSAQQGVQVSSSVNKQGLRVGDNLTFTLRVEGTGPVPQPALPPLDGFKQAGQYQTVENTPQGKVLLFHYLLSPTRAGRITVPSIQVSVGGQVRAVPGFAVEVETAPPQTAGPLSTPTRPLRSDDFLLLGEVSSAKASVGQGVLYTLHLLAKPSVRRLAITSSPDFAGFQRVEDQEAAASQARQRRYGTGTYLDQTLKRYILFPLQPGEISVGDFQVSLTVDVGEYTPRTQEVPLKGGGTNVSVVAVPQPPQGFTGCVGSFSFVADPPPAGTFSVGQPFSLTYRLEGAGFLPQEPVLWPDTPIFQRYPPSVADRIGFEGGVFKARRTVTAAYIPKVAGPAVLPPARLVIYLPGERKFKELEAGSLTITVLGPTAGSRVGDAALSPPVPVPRPAPTPRQPMAPWNFSAFLAAPFLVSLVLWLGILSWERFLADPEKSRRRRLNRAMARELARARRATDTRKHETFHHHLNRALAARLELALGHPAEGLTRPQLREALQEAGWDAEVARRVAELLEDLEAARYAPGQPVLRDLQVRFESAAKIVERG